MVAVELCLMWFTEEWKKSHVLGEFFALIAVGSVGNIWCPFLLANNWLLIMLSWHFNHKHSCLLIRNYLVNKTCLGVGSAFSWGDISRERPQGCQGHPMSIFGKYATLLRHLVWHSERELNRALWRLSSSSFWTTSHTGPNENKNSRKIDFAGAPNVNFQKISVRKTFWDLEFSEHLL